ncbi:RNA polymerase sigma factor [Streptomyces chrestomyceticus]|uniref:RNA polymerase sigma factor n=1 Tax=Streptomyces chrestomyceticus TaxID=68185 RepID=UPI0036D0C189
MQDENCQGRPPQDRTSHTAGAPAEAAPQEQASLRRLEADLASASREDEDARARRLQADAALVAYLRRQDFTGPQYQTVIHGLMEYSWRALSRWSSQGTIFERSARMGRPVPRHKVVASWHERDRSQVVTDSVIKGTGIFREHGLIQGKWTPEGGANLTTYFVGASILAFRSVYIRWYNDHRKGQAELNRPTDAADDALQAQRDIPDQRATDPAQAAVTYNDLAHLRRLLPDPQLREALSWMALGYTQAEAAHRVGLTPKALERRLTRARTKISASGLHQAQLGEGGAR